MSQPSNKRQRVNSSVIPKVTPSNPSVSNATNKSATTTISTSVSEDRQADLHESTPGTVWCLQHDVIPGSGDQTTVNAVVTGNVFPKVKFVDKDTELMYSTDKKSICQYIIRRCNLQPEVNEAQWWRSVHKYVGQTINRLRNDRNTAMKCAMLGKFPM
jgi:hypothetical protein